MKQSCAREHPKKIKVANKQPAARGAPHQDQDTEVVVSAASFICYGKGELACRCGLKEREVNLTV